MLGPDFSPTCPGKKIITIFSQENTDPTAFKGSIDAANGFFKMFGWDLVKTFLIHNASASAYELVVGLLEAAFEAGKGLV